MTLRSVGLIFLLNAGAAVGTIAEMKEDVATTETTLQDIKKSIEEYYEGLNKIDQILQTPIDANTSRNCVVDKINKTRQILALFKKVTYFPSVQTGATVLDEKLEKINKSFVEKTMKVPPTAQKSNETQLKYTKKYMKKIEDKALSKVNRYIKKCASTKKSIAKAQAMVAKFPSQQENADSMAGNMLPVTTLVNTLLTPIQEKFATLTLPMVEVNKQVEPFKVVANVLRSALNLACETLTTNHAMKLIDLLYKFITEDFCIDADNTCIGGQEIADGWYTLPKKCLGELIGSLKKCMSVKDLLEFKLCATAPDACVPHTSYCLSDYVNSMEVCTDTNFAAIVMDQLKAYMPEWDIPLPFNTSDFTEFTNTDFSKLSPDFDDLDTHFKNYPEIIVNENFHGNKPDATQKKDGSATITGALALDVTNGTALLQDDMARNAVREGIADFYAVKVSYVQVDVMNTGRRLGITHDVAAGAQAAAGAAAGATGTADAGAQAAAVAPVEEKLTVTYTIDFPPNDTLIDAAVAKATNPLDVDAVIQKVQTKVEAAAPTKYAFKKDMAQDPSMIMEVASCKSMANVTYDSKCKSFVDAAFGPNAKGCWMTTKTPTSFSKAALDSLCDCPQKVEIIARIDQDVKCGLEDEACDGFKPTTPGHTWGSMVPGCATTFADVKKTEEALVAKKVAEDAKSGGGSSGHGHSGHGHDHSDTEGTASGSIATVASFAVLLVSVSLWAGPLALSSV